MKRIMDAAAAVAMVAGLPAILALCEKGAQWLDVVLAHLWA